MLGNLEGNETRYTQKVLHLHRGSVEMLSRGCGRGHDRMAMVTAAVSGTARRCDGKCVTRDSEVLCSLYAREVEDIVCVMGSGLCEFEV